MSKTDTSDRIAELEKAHNSEVVRLQSARIEPALKFKLIEEEREKYNREVAQLQGRE